MTPEIDCMCDDCLDAPEVVEPQPSTQQPHEHFWTHDRLSGRHICVKCGTLSSNEAVSGERTAVPPAKPRVFVDMDGVVVDFDSYKNALGLTGDEVKKRPGAYLAMLPYSEAERGIKWLIGSGYEVWLATKPPTGISFAYADKAEWVFRHFPELKRRIIITHDKGLLGDVRDFLIDDRPHKANCDKFKGTLIPFVDGETWDGVIDKIRRAPADSGAAERAARILKALWEAGYFACDDEKLEHATDLVAAIILEEKAK